MVCSLCARLTCCCGLQDVDHLRDRLDQDLKAYMNEFDTRTTSTLEQLKESVSLDLALEKQYLKEQAWRIDCLDQAEGGAPDDLAELRQSQRVSACEVQAGEKR